VNDVTDAATLLASHVAASRILVIDDNEAIHQDFRKIFGASRSRSTPSAAELALFGSGPGFGGTPEFQIDSAYQGQEGLALVRLAKEQHRPYAMAFVDVRMPPGWDGIETTARIWQHDPDIQIVICTAFSDYSWGEMLAKLGRSDRLVILKKPFDTIEVVQLASALTEKWRLARQSRSILEDLERRVAERTRELVQTVEDLSRSESLKGAILKSSLDCLITIDHDGKIVEFNPAAEATFGLTREQALGKEMVELIVPPRLRNAHRRGFAHYLATGIGPILGKRLELAAIRADGTEFPIELAVTALRATSTPMFTGFIRDITARNEADAKIKRLNRVYAVLSGINSLIVRVRKRDELFGEACRIAVEVGRFRMAWIGVVDAGTMKIEPTASAGLNPDYMTFIKDRFSVAQESPIGETLATRAIREKKALFSNDTQNDPRVRFKKEHFERGTRSMAMLPLLVADEAVGLLALYAEEVDFFDAEEVSLLTELAGHIAFAIDHIGKQERLDYLAYYDELTGLANRSLFLERVAQYMRSAVSGGHKLALFLIDLERFKNINDSLGRPAGDALLKQVAEWITGNVKDASLLSRVAADHFAVVLPQVRPEGNVERLMEKSMEALLEHPFLLNDTVFRIAAKAGIALFPEDGADADTLFKNAEAALKKAKASGDRYLSYTPKMTETVAGKLTLENQLRQALDKEEFVLHYQPKVNLVSGRITSAEALIRWNDPRTGLVPPGRFIPVLEETGLIYEVGRWALRKALEDYLRWRNAGLPAVRIAVNVSPLQLRNRSFVAEIKQVIGIDAQAEAGLELEITESLIMEDVKHNIASLQAIRAMGVTIAIDDFGTGFSSLNYLSKLPVDTLKIDRSFVIDMTGAPQGLALVSTIITLAHSLKLKVVAEGVETEEQLRLLRSLSCDEMQGFLFSKPVPGEIFEARYLAAPAKPDAT
jgi:diguanylate cyclase (GGDEF)-like protein/PAS domain S-box-containing protein